MIRPLVIVMAMTALALLSGCTRRPPRAVDASRMVKDGLGREVRLPATIHRVISLAPSSTELVCALGAEALLVGIDRYSDWPHSIASLERVGTDLDPSLERIIALRPDVVLTATSANGQKTVDALERAGIAVYVSAPRRLDEILDDVGSVGAALGRGGDGEALRRSLGARVEAVRRSAAGQALTKTLVVVWPDPLVVAGAETHVDDLIRAAGGENTAGDSKAWPNYSLERVIASAPSVIVVGSHDNTRTVPPALADLSNRVRRSRIAVVEGDLLFRPGPRVVDGLEALYVLLHPEHHPDEPPDAASAR